MKDKKFLSYIKSPPNWLMVLTFCLTFLFASTSLILLLLNLGETFYAFIIYAFAGIMLVYAVYLIVLLAPRIKKSFINTLKRYKFTRRIYEDYGFRTVVFSCFSLVVNLAFGAFEIAIGILSLSIWYGALGLYHLMLSLTRFGIVIKYYKNKSNYHLKDKLKTYFSTGICILVFNLALSGAIIQMIFSKRAFEYAGLMIYFIATYAFWKISVSIWGIIKAKKHNDYATQSFRNLNLTDALVTLYALQTALIATFSINEGTNVEFLNIITGVAVTAISIFIGIYMIVKSKEENNKLNQTNKGEI